MKKNVLYAIMLLSSVCMYAEDCYVSFTKGQRATIILPVAPDAEKGRYYKLDRVENRQIIFEEEVSPRARVPYIIVPKEDFKVDLNVLDLNGLYHDTISIKGIWFIGTYKHERMDYLECHYIDIIDITSDCCPEGPSSPMPIVGALRAYLEVDYKTYPDPKWEMMEVVLHDKAVFLDLLKAQPSVNTGIIYNLQGRRLMKAPEKGLYIQDGKKVVIK